MHHDYDGNAAVLQSALERDGAAALTLTHDAGGLRPEAIGGYDVVALYTLRWSGSTMPEYRGIGPEEQAGLEAWVREGGGLVAIHSGVGCFEAWPEYRRMLGGAWNWQKSAHDPYQEMRVKVEPGAHAITEGLSDFTIMDELYHTMDFDPGLRVLARAVSVQTGENAPVAWMNAYGKGRVFCTALGHGRESWENPAFQRLIARGLTWARGSDR